jgi:hypothetical protein
LTKNSHHDHFSFHNTSALVPASPPFGPEPAGGRKGPVALPSGATLDKHDHEALFPSTCHKASLCEGLPLRPWPTRARHVSRRCSAGGAPAGGRSERAPEPGAHAQRRRASSAEARRRKRAPPGQKQRGANPLGEAPRDEAMLLTADSVRRGGLEPPRCYPLAPQISNLGRFCLEMAFVTCRATVILRQEINNLGAELGVHPAERLDVLLPFALPERFDWPPVGAGNLCNILLLLIFGRNVFLHPRWR